MTTSSPEICAQSDPPPFETAQFRPIFAYSASSVRANEKSSISASRPRAFQRAIDEPCTLPPTGGTKRDLDIFSSKFQLLSNKVCHKVSLCENFQWQKL